MYVNRQIADLLLEAVRRYGRIELPAYGTSMSPLIGKGDLCAFVPCEAAALRKGDIVLFLNEAEQLVAHRVVAVARDARGPLLVTKGDANAAVDPPFRADRLIGKLARVRKRGGRTVAMDGLAARAWAWSVRSIPAASAFARRYAAERRRKDGTGADGR